MERSRSAKSGELFGSVFRSTLIGGNVEEVIVSLCERSVAVAVFVAALARAESTADSSENSIHSVRLACPVSH
jgi:hypothetical protein